MKNNLGLYIHLPICKTKCRYCDFNSIPHPSLIASYTEALLINIKLLTEKYNLKGSGVDTVYFGGGTPSIFTINQIKKILKAIKGNYKVTKNAEVTIETNPESINENKIKVYKEIGFNRISLGIQSLEDEILKEIGRPHNKVQALKAINIIKKYFKNFSIDLIFGLPGQTLASFENELNIIKKFNPPHISLYLLDLKENAKEKWNLELPKDEEIPEFFNLITNNLKDINIKQYEISNYSKPKYESKHNRKYWQDEEYLGFGAGAHSYLKLYDFGIRFEVESDIFSFIKSSIEENALNFTMFEKLGSLESKLDYVCTGLRMNDGVHLKSYKNKYKEELKNTFKNAVRKNLKNKFLTIGNNRLKLTNLGRLFSNQVFLNFYEEN